MPGGRSLLRKDHFRKPKFIPKLCFRQLFRGLLANPHLLNLVSIIYYIRFDPKVKPFLFGPVPFLFLGWPDRAEQSARVYLQPSNEWDRFSSECVYCFVVRAERAVRVHVGQTAIDSRARSRDRHAILARPDRPHSRCAQRAEWTCAPSARTAHTTHHQTADQQSQGTLLLQKVILFWPKFLASDSPTLNFLTFNHFRFLFISFIIRSFYDAVL